MGLGLHGGRVGFLVRIVRREVQTPHRVENMKVTAGIL